MPPLPPDAAGRSPPRPQGTVRHLLREDQRRLATTACVPESVDVPSARKHHAPQYSPPDPAANAFPRPSARIRRPASRGERNSSARVFPVRRRSPHRPQARSLPGACRVRPHTECASPLAAGEDDNFLPKDDITDCVPQASWHPSAPLRNAAPSDPPRHTKPLPQSYHFVRQSPGNSIPQNWVPSEKETTPVAPQA